jgi:hypothetical protein
MVMQKQTFSSEFVDQFDYYINSISWQLIEETILPYWNGSRTQYVNYIESISNFSITAGKAVDV